MTQSSVLLGGSGIEQHMYGATKGAAAAPVGKGGREKTNSHLQSNPSIVCPIYQSKDFRLMSGQHGNAFTTKNSSSSHYASNQVFSKIVESSSKTDQKDVKRGSGERKESNKGTTSSGGSTSTHGNA